MIVDIQTRRLRTIEQLRAFVEGAGVAGRGRVYRSDVQALHGLGGTGCPRRSRWLEYRGLS